MKALVVDDEPTTRNSLKEFIPWSSIGIDEVELARNGLDALKKAEDYKPDILICDIHMPKMSGTELATKIRDMFPQCKIIFLSAYSDKKYLKTAITLKAVNYIEKPIDIDEVTSVLKVAVSQRNFETDKEEKISQLEKAYDDGIPILKEQLVNNIIYSDSFTNDDSRFQPFFKDNSRYQCSVMSFSWNEGKCECEIISLKQEILKIPLEFTDESSFLCGFINSNTFVYIENLDLNNSSYESSAIKTFYRICKLSGDNFSVSMGIGSTVYNANDIRSSFKTASDVVKQRFYYDDNRIFANVNPSSGTFKTCDKTFQAFKQLIESRNIPGAIEFVNNLGKKARDAHDKNIDYVKNVFFNLLVIIINASESKDKPNNLGSNYFWQTYNNISLLSEAINIVILQIQSSFGDYMYYNNCNKKIYEVIMYIRSNYSDKNLSIRKISDNMYLSHTYLCALFKKSTGKTINEYITELRIEKAKEILKDPNKKLYEIAESVGFSDPNYFSTIFKRLVGCTPTEFRDGAPL